jgi:DNA-binding CsgD family transcriptional regulator
MRAADRPVWLAAMIVVQALATAFLLRDAIADLGGRGWSAHVVASAMIAACLAIGTVLTALELRRSLSAAARFDAALAAASGAMTALIRLRCAEWQLTPAEADIALLAIKGLGPDEIARIRGTAQRDIRAHLTRIYAKAGVNSRAGLASLLVEDLLTEPLRAPAARTVAAAHLFPLGKE